MQRQIRFAVIGAGLMGREFASATARWLHLTNLSFEPVIVAVCDTNPSTLTWFVENLPTVEKTTTDYHELLTDPGIDAVYCAVPHHLHADLYTDIIRAGKHLLGEKPFGIDMAANQRILDEIVKHPDVLVRCSSEFPFYPGPYRIAELVRQNPFGKIIEVEAGFWHSSDLDPNKPINWKRQIEINGEYGCMGDLGMHVVHLPFRFGWFPKTVRALLSNIVTERVNSNGECVPCKTWDNAILACDVETAEQSFPLTLSTKRIAPGHSNTWFMRIMGTDFSLEYSTKNPKQLLTLTYASGMEQSWQSTDLPHRSAYGSITGNIFEFGFSDSILQMWAAFCDEMVNGSNMTQSVYCASPEETMQSHKLFTAALDSQKTGATVRVN